jgi:hypothetical protein
MNLIVDTRGRKGYIALDMEVNLDKDRIVFAVIDGRPGQNIITDYALLSDAHAAFNRLKARWDKGEL